MNLDLHVVVVSVQTTQVTSMKNSKDIVANIHEKYRDKQSDVHVNDIVGDIVVQIDNSKSGKNGKIIVNTGQEEYAGQVTEPRTGFIVYRSGHGTVRIVPIRFRAEGYLL